ncbi:hypothetical protein GEMRC1_000976 [Eukaryota sp. GEM-RC1]
MTNQPIHYISDDDAQPRIISFLTSPRSGSQRLEQNPSTSTSSSDSIASTSTSSSDSSTSPRQRSLEIGPTTSSATSITSPRRSDVWSHIADKNQHPGKKTCIHCREPTWDENSLSTSTIRRHLDKKHPNWDSESPQPTRTLFGTPAEQKAQKQNRLQKLLTQCIVDCDWSFNIAEHKSFQTFLKEMNPDFKLKNRVTQQQLCKTMFFKRSMS